MRTRQRPWLISPGSPPVFPDPRFADEEGLLAVGGDLGPERLLAAYAKGIFPWYDKDLPPLWWSPDPRAVMDHDSLKVSRSMRRELRLFAGEVTYNRAFSQVMTCCGEGRPTGTWILPEMIGAYSRLFELGHAHSVEVWEKAELVGGLYGTQLGGLFAAESMFHRRRNASKIALIVSILDLFNRGITLFDVQFLTPHLESLGAYTVRRSEYLRRVRSALNRSPDLSGLVRADPLSRYRESAGAARDSVP